MDEEEIEKLRTARANYVQQLLDLSDPDKRKPTYSMGGRSVSWVEYMTYLRDSLKAVSDLIDGEEGSPLIITAGD